MLYFFTCNFTVQLLNEEDKKKRSATKMIAELLLQRHLYNEYDGLQL